MHLANMWFGRARIRLAVAGCLALSAMTPGGLPARVRGAEAADTPTPACVAGAQGVASPSVAPSPDGEPTEGGPQLPIGVPWQVVLIPADDICRLDQVVAWEGGFAGLAGTAVWRSEDGQRWSVIQDAVTGAASAEKGSLTLVAYHDGLLLFGIVSGELAVWHSDDASVWTSVASPTFKVPGRLLTVPGVAVDDARVVVLGGVSTPDNPRGCETGPCPNVTAVWRSEDGMNWRRATARTRQGRPLESGDGEPMMLERLFVGPSGFVTIGEGDTLLGSPGGVRWTEVGVLPPGIGDVTTEIRYRASDGLTYAIGYSAPDPSTHAQFATVSTTEDLRHWTQVYQLPYEGWGPRDAQISDTGIVIGGSNEPEFPWMLTSADGKIWTLSAGWPGLERGCTDGVAGNETTLVAISSMCEGPAIWESGADDVG